MRHLSKRKRNRVIGGVIALPPMITLDNRFGMSFVVQILLNNREPGSRLIAATVPEETIVNHLRCVPEFPLYKGGEVWFTGQFRGDEFIAHWIVVDEDEQNNLEKLRTEFLLRQSGKHTEEQAQLLF